MWTDVVKASCAQVLRVWEHRMFEDEGLVFSAWGLYCGYTIMRTGLEQKLTNQQAVKQTNTKTNTLTHAHNIKDSKQSEHRKSCVTLTENKRRHDY